MPVSREECDNPQITTSWASENIHYEYVCSSDAWLTGMCYQEKAGPLFSGPQAKRELAHEALLINILET